MNELIAKIKELSNSLLEDAALELEKVLKEFRKVSLEESKK